MRKFLHGWLLNMTLAVYNMMMTVYNKVTNAMGIGISKAQLKENVENFLKLQDQVAKEQRDTHNQNDEVQETGCFRQSGFITKLDATHGVIDDKFCFAIEKAADVHADLKLKDKVKYLARNDSPDATIRIVRILSIEQDHWGEVVTDKQILEKVEQQRNDPPEYLKTFRRSFSAVVLQKNGGTIVLSEGDGTLVDLDLVKAEFVPKVGDRLQFVALVEQSDDFVGGAGENIDVIEIKCDVMKEKKAGFVSQVDIVRRSGVIDRKFFFYFDALHEDYQMPQVKDAVIYTAISSEQPGGYVWRCIHVVLNESRNRDLDQYDSQPAIRNNDNVDTRNKNGIEIPDHLRVTFSECGTTKVLKFIVSNNGTERQKILRSIFKEKNQSECTLRVPTSHQTIILEPGQEFEYQIDIKAFMFGTFTCIFTIHFEGNFGIQRYIAIDVINESQPIPSLGSNVISQTRSHNTSHTLDLWKKQRDAIPGQRIAQKANFVFLKFDSFHVPENLKTAVLEMATMDEVNEKLMLITPFQDGLSIKTYRKFMDYLLYLEEIQMFHNMRRYDLNRAHFVKEGEYLALHMKNIAEARPSIVVGDSIKAFSPWSEDELDRPAEGCIHKVLSDKIYLKFNQLFHDKYDGSDYRIQFHFSRSSLCKQHHAIKSVVQKMGEDFLFPSKIKTNKSLQLDVELSNGDLVCTDIFGEKTLLKWFNKNLNSIQKEAVKNILRGEARPMPYIVFGPPGTGKTVTIIETILQLSTNIKDSRILVATPSNSAADLITEHLIDSNAFIDGQFVRLVGFNAIEREMIPQHLLRYCSTIDIARPGTAKDEMQVTKSGLKLRCNADVLGRHRITIGTCNTIGTLMQLQFPRDHFTHAVIDECGQCIEPEVLIPATFLSKDSGQVIFAGDPMQLGPVVLSRHAINNGLETSFLVRLLKRFPYQKDIERFAMGYDPRLVTKLLYCYRSLPSILKPFNELSYNNELRAVISETDSAESKLLQKLHDILPNKETKTPHHGVFFIGSHGENQRELDSPSWYNAVEARNICNLVMQLYGKGFEPDDIGIITPYQKQVRHIRLLINSYDMVPPKVGTVEEFQGQERNIILVSTVRSSTKLLREHDIKHQLGFVMCLKRLNVAISRPRALLMVFGNPSLLARDNNWRHLLKYCVNNGSYTGVELPSCLAEDDE